MTLASGPFFPTEWILAALIFLASIALALLALTVYSPRLMRTAGVLLLLVMILTAPMLGFGMNVVGLVPLGAALLGVGALIVAPRCIPEGERRRKWETER